MKFFKRRKSRRSLNHTALKDKTQKLNAEEASSLRVKIDEASTSTDTFRTGNSSSEEDESVDLFAHQEETSEQKDLALEKKESTEELDLQEMKEVLKTVGCIVTKPPERQRNVPLLPPPAFQNKHSSARPSSSNEPVWKRRLRDAKEGQSQPKQLKPLKPAAPQEPEVTRTMVDESVDKKVLTDEEKGSEEKRSEVDQHLDKESDAITPSKDDLSRKKYQPNKKNSARLKRNGSLRKTKSSRSRRFGSPEREDGADVFSVETPSLWTNEESTHASRSYADYSYESGSYATDSYDSRSYYSEDDLSNILSNFQANCQAPSCPGLNSKGRRRDHEADEEGCDVGDVGDVGRKIADYPLVKDLRHVADLLLKDSLCYSCVNDEVEGKK